MGATSLRLAVDTNVLLDLADRDETVLDAVQVLEERIPHADWLVPPSVLDEVAFLADAGDTLAVRESATEAFLLIRERTHLRALLDLPFPQQQIRRVADELRGCELIPMSEVHDSFILAEAAFLGCAILLSSDAHLCGIDHELLTLRLNPFGVTPPVIASPREIVRKFFR